MAVTGSPATFGDMSEPVTLRDAVAVLLATLLSFVAPVVPVNVDVPVVVGVPVTVHVKDAPGAIAAGGVGEQLDVRPAGRPAIEHAALVAVTAGDDAFEHV